MSERKVLNKYYPPDFDPVKLATKGKYIRKQELATQKKKQVGPKQMNVRMMMPFTMSCSTCQEFAYVGTKFNSRVEKVQNENYLGIAIWRFYGKCPNCRAEFAFKTDPQNTAYILEAGGTRTYDPHRDASLAESSLKERIRSELEGDAMKALEHKTYTTANELMELEQLDELRKMNKRLLKPDEVADVALEWLTENRETEGLTTEDLEDLDSAKEEMSRRDLRALIRAEEDSDIEEDDRKAKKETEVVAKEEVKNSSLVKSKVKVLVKKRQTAPEKAEANSSAKRSKCGTGQLLAGYSSSESDRG